MSSLRVKDVMTFDLSTVRPETPIWKAWQIMRDAGGHHLPVLEGGRAVGVVSDRDLKLVSSHLESDALSVAEAMTPEPYTVSAEATVTEVVRKMIECHYGSALIIDKDKKVIGLFTVHDALRVLAQQLSQESSEQDNAGG